MLTSTTAFNEIRRTLTNYLKNYVYPNTARVECNFDYEWSVEKGNSEEEEAAIRLLTWMLGNNYQNTLMISRNNDGQIPINTDCFMAKMQQKNYEPIMSIYDKFVFENN